MSEPSVSNKLAERRKKDPDLKSLRTLNRELKKSDMQVLDAIRAAKVLAKIEEVGVEMKTRDLAGAESLFSTYGDRVVEAVEAGQKVTRLLEETKKSLDELVADVEKLKEQLVENTRRLGDLNREIAEKGKRLGVVSDLEALQNDLTSMKTSAKALKGFILLHKQLESLGFDEKTALVLATELEKSGLVPEKAAEELARAVDKHKSLHANVLDLEKEKSRLTAEVGRLSHQSGTINTQVESGKEQVLALAREVRGLKSTSRTLNKSIKGAGKTAEKSMHSIASTAKKDIRGVRKEAVDNLKATGKDLNDELIASTSRFSDAATAAAEKANEAKGEMEEALKQAVDVGRQIQGLDPIQKAYQFISTGEGEPNEVLRVAIDFMEQLLKWEESRPWKPNTYYLDKAMEETKRNWDKSLKT